MAYLHNRILKSFLILCEGKDVENFLVSYLNSDALAYDSHFSNDIQTYNFGGIDNLSAFIGSLVRMENFDTVHHFLILRDAETDVRKAENMVKNAFRNNGLSVPSKCHEWQNEAEASDWDTATAFTLLPACNANPVPGALEDLCWDILKDEHASKMRMDVVGFIKEIMKNYGTLSTHEHKGRLHTYFSVNEKYISLKIGEAAQAGAFDWGSEKLNELKKLIIAGFCCE